MRKFYLLLIITAVFCSVKAQNVGIGTISPSPNAILHLENNSSNLGLLLPNVDISLFLPSPLVTDEGMMVYDSTLDQIYTWDGTAWQTPGGGSFWDLNGNAGTNDAVNFIGTTDGQDLVFRTNNFQRMRIDVAGRAGFNIIPLAANQFSIATSTSDQGLGVNNSRASASSNTGIRGDASNSTSVNNGIFGNAFGAGSTSRGVYGTSGTAATAIGVEGAVTGAGVTTAFGVRGAATSTGTDNYGVYGEASGGTNNYAGYFQGNSVVTGNLGVGTTSPANRLEVIGDAAKFDSVIIANNAQAGYVLTAADATGAASWQPVSGGNSWNLLGNAGTNPTTNFLGTTDAQPLRFATGAGGVERMRILATGNVGIGTVTPGAKLNIHEPNIAATAPTVLTLTGASTGGGSIGMEFSSTNGSAETNTAAITLKNFTANDKSLQFLNANPNAISTTRIFRFLDNTTAPVLTMLNSGNVGIGTENPINLLHVTGDAARFDSVIISNNAQAGYVLTAADATGAASWQPAAGSISGTGAANKLAYWTAANTLSFNSGLHYESGNQRLGIGTAAPAEFLHVNSGNPITVASRFTNATTGFTGSDGFGFGITGTGNAFINNDEATPINISTASTTRMTIGATGNIGIGNNAPNAPLQFATALANRKIVLFEGANNDHQYFGFGVNGAALRYQVNGTFASHIFYASVNTTTSNELMRIVGDGNVGIGVSAPSERLHISSSAGSTGMVITNDFLGTTATDGLLIGISGSNAVTINNRENGPLLLGTNGLPNINQLVLDPSGNVGLNITPPTERLHVNGNLRLAGAFMPNNLPGAAGDVLISSGAGTAPTWGSAPASVGTGTINRLTYWNTSSSIASGSNLGWNNALEYLGVGIGLPERPLHLHRASADDVFAKFTNTVSFIGAGNGFEIGLSSSNEVLLRHYENTSMRFYTNNAERMTIDGSGNLGFGTPPVAGNRITARIGSSSGTAGYFENSISGINGNALTVINSGTRSIGHNGMLVQNLVTKAGGSNSTKIGLKVESTGSWGPGTTNQPNVGIDVTVSGADDNYAAILNGGNVGIGTSSPSAALDVDGGGSIEIDGEYTYENPKIHYEFLNAAQFRSINAQEEFRLNGPFTDNATDVYGYFTGSASAQYAHAMAQVHLPNGAQITNMTAYVFDNEPNGLVWDQARVALRRQGTDIGGAGSSNLGLINFAVNNGTAIQTQGTAISETVDNNQFMYTVTYIADRFSGTNQRLYGVKITYTVDQAD